MRCRPRSASKLAVAYLEKGQWASAAGEFERVAAASKDPKIARDALWQAAELYEKAERASRTAAKAYERYLALVPAAARAGDRGALSARADRQGRRQLAREAALMKRDLRRRPGRRRGAHRPHPLPRRDRGAGDGRAGGRAEYRKVALVEPLQRQLKLKKAKMEEALKAYAVAADYGVADVTTAATYPHRHASTATSARR